MLMYMYHNSWFKQQRTVTRNQFNRMHRLIYFGNLTLDDKAPLWCGDRTAVKSSREHWYSREAYWLGLIWARINTEGTWSSQVAPAMLKRQLCEGKGCHKSKVAAGALCPWLTLLRRCRPWGAASLFPRVLHRKRVRSLYNTAPFLVVLTNNIA